MTALSKIMIFDKVLIISWILLKRFDKFFTRINEIWRQITLEIYNVAFKTVNNNTEDFNTINSNNAQLLGHK